MIALQPYIGLIKAIVFALAMTVIGALLYMGGRDSGKVDMAAQVTAKSIALRDAAHALRAAGTALREVNAEAKRRIAAAAAAKREAERAGIAAAAARHAAEARAAEYKRRLDAARRVPACARLLDTDVEAICGL